MRAASAEGRAVGVKRGIPRREAEARRPEAAIVDADPSLEARTFGVAARWRRLRRVSCSIGRAGARSLHADRPGTSAATNRAARVPATVGDVLGDAGVVCVGIADGGFAARSRGARRCARTRWLGRVLAPWPVFVFEDDELASPADPARCADVGHAGCAPRRRGAGRFGNVGHAFYDLARGLDTAPPVLRRATARSGGAGRARPAERQASTWPAFAAKGLADRLLMRLADRGLASAS